MNQPKILSIHISPFPKGGLRGIYLFLSLLFIHSLLIADQKNELPLLEGLDTVWVTGLGEPCGITVDRQDNVYVADTQNNRILRYDPKGNLISQWGVKDPLEGQISQPEGIAIGREGNAFITDTHNNRVLKVSFKGIFVSSWDAWGSKGDSDGKFLAPEGIVLNSTGTLYVADSLNHRIQYFDPKGQFLGKWGENGLETRQFQRPSGIASDSFGNIYVADTLNHRVQVFDLKGGFLLSWGTKGDQDGQFDSPTSIALDSSGNVYVLDTGNDRIQKFNKKGEILGKWGLSGNGNGQFNLPRGIAVNSLGDVFVSDTKNNRIQKFTAEAASVYVFLTKLNFALEEAKANISSAESQRSQTMSNITPDEQGDDEGYDEYRARLIRIKEQKSEMERNYREQVAKAKNMSRIRIQGILDEVHTANETYMLEHYDPDREKFSGSIRFWNQNVSFDLPVLRPEAPDFEKESSLRAVISYRITKDLGKNVVRITVMHHGSEFYTWIPTEKIVLENQSKKPAFVAMKKQLQEIFR